MINYSMSCIKLKSCAKYSLIMITIVMRCYFNKPAVIITYPPLLIVQRKDFGLPNEGLE